MQFTATARRDVLEIVSFIGHREGKAMASEIRALLAQAADSLARMPERGRKPPELQKIGVESFRELIKPPYRLIYQLNSASRTVIIYLVADGRRNLADLLRARLFNQPAAS